MRGFFRRATGLPCLAPRAARNLNTRRKIGSPAGIPGAIPAAIYTAIPAMISRAFCHDILRNPLQKALFCGENNKQWLKTRWKAASGAALPLSSGA